MGLPGAYRQTRRWLNRNPAVKWTLNIVTIILFIISLPGIRDDTISWGQWLTNPGWLHWSRTIGGWSVNALDDGWQWGLLAVTAIALMAVNAPPKVWETAPQQIDKFRPSTSRREAEASSAPTEEEVPDNSAPQRGHSLKTTIKEAEFQTANCVADHRIFEDSVELVLSFLNSPPSLAKITCVIVDPAGVHTSAEGDSYSLVTFITNPNVKRSYPKDFPGGTRLRTGNYSVTWLRESTITMGGLFDRPHIIARDAFTVG